VIVGMFSVQQLPENSDEAESLSRSIVSIPFEYGITSEGAEEFKLLDTLHQYVQNSRHAMSPMLQVIKHLFPEEFVQKEEVG